MKNVLTSLVNLESTDYTDEILEFADQLHYAMYSEGDKSYSAFPENQQIRCAGKDGLFATQRSTIVRSKSGRFIGKHLVFGHVSAGAQARAMNKIGEELQKTAQTSDLTIAAPRQYAVVESGLGGLGAIIMDNAGGYGGHLAKTLASNEMEPFRGVNILDSITDEVRARTPKSLAYLLDDIQSNNILVEGDVWPGTQWQDLHFTLIDQPGKARNAARFLLSERFDRSNA